MKFKVGDKVRIKLVGYAGSEAEIVDVFNMCGIPGYKLKIDGVSHIATWWDSELELVEPDTFTKADLKDGMVVEYRNGSREMVFGSRTIDKAGWHNLDEYSESLTEERYHFAHHNIDKVYKVNNNTVYNFNDVFKDEYLELIWERKEEPEHKEMTVEEIEEKLGYKIKVIADK